MFGTAPTPTVYAFDLLGAVGCGGRPKTCTPRWTAPLPGASFIVGATLSAGRLFVTTDVGLYAFDATTATGCTGSPLVCSPLWTASPDHSTAGVSDLAVVDGTVYVATNRLYVYDAAGAAGCAGSPKVCAPEWTSANGFGGTPDVWNGTIFVAPFGGGVAAFSSDGTTGCSGSPKVCTPRWTAPVPVGGPTAVVDGVVYIGQENSGPPGQAPTNLVAVDATGTTNCGGSPKVCTPLWTAPLGSGFGGTALVTPPAIENGTVFVAGPDAVVKAFDAAGRSGCSGSPKVCTPRWRTSAQGNGFRVVVANGLLYSGTGVYDATGTQGCSGAPKVCSPITTLPSEPMIANGRAVFSTGSSVPSPHFAVQVFRLP